MSRGEAGMTLIEVLVAGLLLVIGILAAAQLVASSDSTTLDAELQQIATERAERQIEAVRSLDYAEIGHGDAVPGEQPAGADVLAGDGFKPLNGGDEEEFVALVNGPDGDGSVSAAPQPFAVERGQGKLPVTGTVYTFLSWRSESCSLLRLEELEEISELLGDLGALNGALAPLIGSGGLVQQTLNSLTDLLVSLLGNESNLLRQELNQLKPLIATAFTSLDGAQSLLADIASLEIDLCSLEREDFEALEALLSLSAGDLLNDLTGSLISLEGELRALQDAIDSLGVITNLTCTLLPILCNQARQAVRDVRAVLNPTDCDPPETMLGGLNDALGRFTAIDPSALTRTTTHNTKRVTVAVTIDTPRPDITPRNPVWLSSVVTNPNAGVLLEIEPMSGGCS